MSEEILDQELGERVGRDRPRRLLRHESQ
jgi:hypothetical protein